MEDEKNQPVLLDDLDLPERFNYFLERAENCYEPVSRAAYAEMAKAVALAMIAQGMRKHGAQPI